MASFVQDVPAGKDGVPDWTKVTHPISEPLADKSSGLALASLGQGLESGVSVAETAVKDVINKDVRSTVEPIRAEYTQDLIRTRDALNGGAQSLDLTATPQGTAPTNTTQSVPAGIDSGLRRVAAVQNMMVTGGGKIAGDDTYYDMRLKNAVTDLRARYPGFVDYIDQRVSAITGMNPANELVKDLTRQISQLQTSKKSEYDKVVDMARKAIDEGLGNSSQVQNARTMYDFLLKGGEAAKDKYLDWYYEERAKRANLEDKARARQSAQGDKQDREDQWHKDYNTEISTLMSTNMNTLLTVTGMGEQNSLMGFIKDAAQNPGKYNDVQLRQFAAFVEAQKTATLGEAQSIAVRPQKDGQSYNNVVDSGKLETSRANIIGRYYESITDALNKGNAGLAFQNAVRAKALVDVKTDEVYSGPEGQNILLLNVIKNSIGDAAMANASTASINNGIDKSVKKLFEVEVLKGKAGAQSSAANPTAAQPTYKDFANKILSVQQSGKITERMRARYLDEGLNTFINDIVDPKNSDPEKQNAIKFFFSPEGQGILQNFKNDYTKDGVYYPGRQTVWNKLSSPDVVENVKKQAAKDPTIGTMYRNWMEKEAGAQLYIKDLLNLNGYTRNGDVNINYHDGDKGGVPQIELVNRQGLPLQAKDLGPSNVDVNYYNSMRSTVERVNQALTGMDRVYKAFGGNASDRLLSFLLTNQENVQNGWIGLPKDLMDAIAANRGKGKLKDVMEKGVTK